MESPEEQQIELQTIASNGNTSQNAEQGYSNKRAVLIVLASFFLTFTGCGLNFAFGIYQELYESLDGPFANASPATIDLIGTLSVSLMTIGAPFASAWTKAYSPRKVTLAGAVILGLGNVLASFGQQLWHFILTQGLIVGIGACLSYIPAVTVAPGWFDRRRGLALGIILAGTGVGGVFWAPILRLLNVSIGFRNTLRLTGALGFLMITASAFILAWDPETERRIRLERLLSTNAGSARSIPLVNWRVAGSRKFVAHALGAMLQAAAYYTPVYFFSSYSRTLGYTAAAGANFISASNASSAVGKIILGYVGDRIGRLNTLLLCTLVSAFTALGLWFPSTFLGGDGGGGTSKALFVAFAITYGIFAGAYVSLFPTSLVELFGVQNFASVNGFLYMVRGFGTLLGTPIAGSLIRSGKHASGGDPFQTSPRGYMNSSVMVGTLLAGATFAVLWVRLEAAGLSQLKA